MVDVRRGQVWWVDFGEPDGSKPAYERPVLVVQSNAFNASGIATLLVVPLTGTLRLADAPGNVRLAKRRSKLPKDCVANVSQVGPMNRKQLLRYHGSLSDDLLAQVDGGLRLVLGFS